MEFFLRIILEKLENFIAMQEFKKKSLFLIILLYCKQLTSQVKCQMFKIYYKYILFLCLCIFNILTKY